MMSSRAHAPATLVLALMLMSGFPGPSGAQDQAVKVPSGQGESGAVMSAPPIAGAPKSDGPRKDPPKGDGTGAPELQSVQSAPGGDDGLDRARAAARAADPRLEGLEKARDAARKAAGQTGGKDCLSAREARSAVQAKRAVTLSQALRAARDAWDGEVIDYKLCTFDGVLAYDLTLLNGGGRVARVRVGAADGKLVNVR